MADVKCGFMLKCGKYFAFALLQVRPPTTLSFVQVNQLSHGNDGGLY